MVNVDDAYEIGESGLAVTDNDGNVLFYLASGSGSPVGSAAPDATVYIRSSDNTIWRKVGPAASDWRQLSAEDILAQDTSQDPVVQSNIQDLLTQLLAGDTPAVSQTSVFGDGGNTSQNSYLPNEGVSSNIVGFPIGLANASIRSIFLGNDNVRTGNVLIQERSPFGTGSFQTIHTFSLNNQSFKTETGLNVPVTQNAEIAVFTEISLKNVKVVVNVNGDSA